MSINPQKSRWLCFSLVKWRTPYINHMTKHRPNKPILLVHVQSGTFSEHWESLLRSLKTSRWRSSCRRTRRNMLSFFFKHRKLLPPDQAICIACFAPSPWVGYAHRTMFTCYIKKLPSGGKLTSIFIELNCLGSLSKPLSPWSLHHLYFVKDTQRLTRVCTR